MIEHETRHLVQAYVDNELDAAGVSRVEALMAQSPEAAQLANKLRQTRTAVREAAPYYATPGDLFSGVRAALHAQQPAQRRRVALPWAAAAAAAGLAIGSTVTFLLFSQNAQDIQSRVAVSEHVRALRLGRSIDVASSDRHTVKPWYADKLDYSPPVPDLRDSGFLLAGGRLEVLDSRSVACLVYTRRQHTISVFVVPREQSNSGQFYLNTRNGMNQVRWAEQDFELLAVSDLNPEELQQFAHAFAAAP
jgi:anti-sigma factor RsiW